MDNEKKKKIEEIKKNKVAKSMKETRDELESKSSEKTKSLLEKTQIGEIRGNWGRGFGFGVSNMSDPRVPRRKRR